MLLPVLMSMVGIAAVKPQVNLDDAVIGFSSMGKVTANISRTDIPQLSGPLLRILRCL